MVSREAVARAERIPNKQENGYASCGLTELNYKCIKGGLDAFFMADIYLPPFFFVFFFFILFVMINIQDRWAHLHHQTSTTFLEVYCE